MSVGGEEGSWIVRPANDIILRAPWPVSLGSIAPLPCHWLDFWVVILAPLALALSVGCSDVVVSPLAPSDGARLHLIAYVGTSVPRLSIFMLLPC